MTAMAVGSLANFAGGLFAVADAAIQSGQGFGMAMLQMVKSTLLGIAQQSIVKAIFQTAEGFAALATPGLQGLAPLHFKAAAIYGTVGVAAGAAGLAISAGTAPSGGGAGTAASGRAPAPRSEFGTRSREREKSVTIVEVFFGDSRDRGAQRFARLQATGRVAA
jgi:hypothetical protein